jgi:DNA-binding NarL/FixJ family response regulator
MTAGKSPIRVVTIDDHALVHEAVRALLDGRDDMVLVGSETNGSRGLKLACELSPDVAVIDIALGDLSGLTVAERLAKETPLTAIVVLTMHEERFYVRKALEAGAKGYVSKRSSGDRLVEALRAAAEGGVYIDPAIAAQLLAVRGSGAAITSEVLEASRAELTEREADVVRLIALGYTAKEIAGHLGVTAKSVETYKARACEKLNMKTRAQLVRYAASQGWLSQV